MSAIDKLEALRNEIQSLKEDIDTKKEKLKAKEAECDLALQVAAEYEEQKAILEMEIEELKASAEDDKKDEAEAFQLHIVEPLRSGDPNKQPDPLKYILSRGLPTPDPEAAEASEEAAQEAVAATG